MLANRRAARQTCRQTSKFNKPIRSGSPLRHGLQCGPPPSSKHASGCPLYLRNILSRPVQGGRPPSSYTGKRLFAPLAKGCVSVVMLRCPCKHSPRKTAATSHESIPCDSVGFSRISVHFNGIQQLRSTACVGVSTPFLFVIMCLCVSVRCLGHVLELFGFVALVSIPRRRPPQRRISQSHAVLSGSGGFPFFSTVPSNFVACLHRLHAVCPRLTDCRAQFRVAMRPRRAVHRRPCTVASSFALRCKNSDLSQCTDWCDGSGRDGHHRSKLVS